MTTRALLLATRNRGKLAELQALLAPLGYEVKCLDDVPEVPPVDEDGDTFEHNAIEKARQTAVAAGMATLADDSGLVVDALGGAPGVWSARYAGPDATDADNNARLLQALSDVPDAERGARFVAVLALCLPPDAPGFRTAIGIDAPLVRTFRGTLEGRIAHAARGDQGFGYDPLFVPDGETQTLAQLGQAQKNRISHRARATAALCEALQQA